VPKEEKQFSILLEILKRFQSAGILKDVMLIGSWCLYFYRADYKKTNVFPAIRTLDADFLIPHHQTLQKEVDVPAFLKEMGFVPTFNRSTGLIVYDHEELRVEFLIPELGKGYDKPQEIKKFHVKAVALRYLNFLINYPKVISHHDLRIRVPEPAAFALHKLIVSTRRSSKEKARKDMDTAVGLLSFLYTMPGEVSRIKSILRTIPKKWLQTILSISKIYFPKLNKTAQDL